jgi:hypothetical protein
VPQPKLYIAAVCLLLVACTKASELSAGDGDDDEDEDDIDLTVWCDDAPGPDLAAVGEPGLDWRMGRCGHLAGGDLGTLIHPDGERELLGDLVERPQFSATGHLLAWSDPTALTLRDLRRGSTRIITGDYSHRGFVPSRDPQIGARLWACDDELRIYGMADEQIFGQASCSSIVASSGSPMLAFPRSNGTIWLGDADTGEARQIAAGFVEKSSWDVDALSIDHDGQVLIHHHYGLIQYEHFDDYGEIGGTLYTADGEVLFSHSDPLRMWQAPTPGAPVFIVAWGFGVVFEGKYHELSMRPPGQLTRAGDLLASSMDGVRLYPAEQPTTPLLLAEFNAKACGISPDGNSAFVFEYLTDCGDLGCEFSQPLHAWSPETGMVTVLQTVQTPAHVDEVFDSGVALVRATLERPAPGEPNDERRLIVGREGIIADLGSSSVHFRVQGRLADGRHVAARDVGSGSKLVLVEFETGSIEVLAELEDIQFGPPWVPQSWPQIDGMGQRIAFPASSTGDMHWGRVP